MGVEIERKYLVNKAKWRATSAGTPYRQGYLSAGGDITVRVRIAGDTAWVTLKGPTRGLSRAEFEYPIPLNDAEEMLQTLCRQPLIEKTRYHVEYQGHVWDVDVFHGANAGLMLAEIELDSESETFAEPPWLGREVSGDSRFFNSTLAVSPYSPPSAEETITNG